jgi:hypothetical protein
MCCAQKELLVPPYPAGLVGAKDDSRHFITDKISDDLLMIFVAEKSILFIMRRVVLHGFRRNLTLRPTTHHDVIYPHA